MADIADAARRHQPQRQPGPLMTRAVDEQRARLELLRGARSAAALKLCAAFRAPGEPAPTVEEVASARSRLDRELAATRRRIAIAEAAENSAT